MGHTFAADEVAESIGWPTGNPFQTEVAVANLAIGTLGILSYYSSFHIGRSCRVA